MGVTARRKSSTLELGAATRQDISYIIKHSDTVYTLVGVVRTLTKKYKGLLQLEAQALKHGGTLSLVTRDAKGMIIQEMSTDFKL